MTREWIENPKTVTTKQAIAGTNSEVSVQIRFAPNGHVGFAVTFDTANTGAGVSVQLLFAFDDKGLKTTQATRKVCFYDNGSHTGCGALDSDGFAMFKRSRGEVAKALDIRSTISSLAA